VIEYEIIISYTGNGYSATIKDHDSAPDAIGPESFVGFGGTEEAAREDLEEQLSDHAQDLKADLGDFLYEQQKDKGL
jgi:hypothetical protein